MTEKTKNKYAVPLTPYAPGGDLGVSMNAKKTADDFLKEASRKCFSEKDIVIDSIARPYILEAMEAFHQSKRVEDERGLKKYRIEYEGTEIVQEKYLIPKSMPYFIEGSAMHEAIETGVIKLPHSQGGEHKVKITEL